MTEDQLELEQQEREYAAREREYAERKWEEEQAQIAQFNDAAHEVSEHIDFLFQGYFPQGLRTNLGNKCAEAMTLSHIYQSWPDLKELHACRNCPDRPCTCDSGGDDCSEVPF